MSGKAINFIDRDVSTAVLPVISTQLRKTFWKRFFFFHQQNLAASDTIQEVSSSCHCHVKVIDFATELQKQVTNEMMS